MATIPPEALEPAREPYPVTAQTQQMIELFESTLYDRFPSALGKHFEDFGNAIRPRDAAKKFPLVGFDRNQKWIAVDIDLSPEQQRAYRDGTGPGGALAGFDDGILANLTMTNPATGNAHLLFLLEKPCFRDPKKPYEPVSMYLRNIFTGLKHAVGGDLNYNGNLFKNPLRTDLYHVQSFRTRPYAFAEFEGLFDLPTSFGGNPAEAAVAEHDESSRNITLFNELRLWARKNKPLYGTETALRHALMEYADQINELEFAHWDAGRMGYAEMQRTSKSVSLWMWSNWTPLKHQKLLGLDPKLDLSERQRLGQEYTVKKMRGKTNDKLSESLAHFLASGKKITQKALAAHAGVSLSSVRRRWEEIQGLLLAHHGSSSPAFEEV